MLKEHVTLLENIMNGDSKAFKAFYYTWEVRIFSYFLKRTKDYEITQELTQNTFIKIWEYRSTLSKDYTLEVQLFRKAKLIYIDWLRKQAHLQKRIAAEQNYALQHWTHLEEPSDQPIREKIENALRHLPPMRQQVIRLSHIQGYAYKEIARRLDISEKTVDNHIYKAIKQLRQLLNGILLLLMLLLSFY